VVSFDADTNLALRYRDFARVPQERYLQRLARYEIGDTPRAHELAIERAAREVRGLLTANGSAAVTQHQNQLSTLAEAHGEPGTGANGVVPGVPNRVLQPGELARKYGSY